MEKRERVDVHQAVTDAIIAAIEANPGEYRMPWQQSGFACRIPTNAVTGAMYQGLNVLLLWCASAEKGYTSGKFASYRQFASGGLQVRAGEKGTLIVFYKDYEVEPDADNADDDGRRRVAKHSYVFALEQTTAYEPPPLTVAATPLDRHPDMERLVAATGADVRIGGSTAYYRTSADYVQLPDPSLFKQPDAADRTFQFESTVGHELGHWTGAKHRLNRDLTGRFGSEAYCAEEMVAETVAAMLCAHFGISSEPRLDHAQYIAHFLGMMKKDKRAIFAAAAKAAEATRYLLAFLDKEQAHAA